MNRMEEWMALQAEMEQIPAETERTVERAAARLRRRRRLWQPLTAAAMVAVCFVAAVNLSPTVAHACSQVPVLAQLARAVSFSSSLRQAVEQEYVQIVDQTAEDQGVTAHIQSLIVDQKQVHLYFTLESEEYDKLSALPEVFLEDGTAAQAVITGSYGGQSNGELLHAAVDFLPEAQVPETMQVVLRVYDEAAQARKLVAKPTFTLQIDPEYRAQGRTAAVEIPFCLEEEQFWVTGVEIYPTHIRLQVEAAPENRAYLKWMDFSLVLPDGTEIYDGSAAGIGGTSDPVTGERKTFYAESSFFTETDRLELQIHRAGLLDKDAPRTRVDLETGACDSAPLNGECTVETPGEIWCTFDGLPERRFALFEPTLYDSAGAAYPTDGYGMRWDRDGRAQQYLSIPEAFPGTEVYLQPEITRLYAPEQPVTVQLDMTEGKEMAS